MSAITRRHFFSQTAAFAASAQTPSLPATQNEPPRRNLLATAWPQEKLAKTLVAREAWRPCSDSADRRAWDSLPTEVRADLIAAGERGLGQPWPVLPATVFLEFARTGNRSHYEAAWSARRSRLRALTVAECVEGKGRFLDEISNGVWTTCEETFWGYPAHMNLQKRGPGLPDVNEPVIDLFAAETGAQLAWTEYLLGPALVRVHPLVRERIAFEIERRILGPYLAREDWGWMGLKNDRPVNNWNPWINSNCLASALIMDREAPRRAAFVHKVLRSLDRFLDSYYDDGGCDEGPGYWGRAGASLFDNLELLRSASAGAIDFYGAPLVREIGRYIYRVHIYDDWFVNFADASAKAGIPADLVFRYGRRIGDERMAELGAWAAQKSRSARGDSLGRFIPALFNLGEIAKAPASQALARDAWFPGIQVMTARVKEGSAEGLYLAAQGGHNGESHNHNDVGNFIVFANGEPAIIDVGVETYSAKTFSSRRYEIWTMQSAYHNCPTVNGVMQAAGRKYAARDVSYRSTDIAVEFSLGIAGAYPEEAGLESWFRRLRLDRSANQIKILERWRLRKNGGSFQLTLMTPMKPEVDGNRIRLGSRASVSYDPALLEPAVEPIDITDARLKSVWGERLYRILLRSKNIAASGETSLRVVQF